MPAFGKALCPEFVLTLALAPTCALVPVVAGATSCCVGKAELVEVDPAAGLKIVLALAVALAMPPAGSEAGGITDPLGTEAEVAAPGSAGFAGGTGTD